MSTYIGRIKKLIMTLLWDGGRNLYDLNQNNGEEYYLVGRQKLGGNFVVA